MRELFKLLVSREDLSNDEKVSIMRTLMSAIISELYPIEENGLYLRVTDTEDFDKIDVALWYDHKDEDGNISVRPITTDKGEILEALHQKYLEQEKSDNKRIKG